MGIVNNVFKLILLVTKLTLLSCYVFTFLFNCGFYRNDAPCEYAPFSDGLPIKK